MQNQFALWLAIMFGFTSCAEETDTDDSTSGPDLVGTWMEVRTTRVDDDWLSTERSTIIVERDGDQLRFRNCVDDASATATLQDDTTVVINSNRYPDLRLSGADTLTATLDNTDVTLQRIDTATRPVLAALSLQQPGNLDVWTQLCLETRVSDDDGYRLAFRASNSLMGVMVAMDFESDVAFTQQTFGYPDAQRTVSGHFALEGQTGTLSDPSGSLVISDSTTRDFQANLFMTSSDSSTIEINGLLNVDPQWFEAE